MSLDKIGLILADTVYCGTKCVAEDVTVNLPDVEFITSEIKAGGTFAIPGPITNAMSSTVSKVGIDNGLFSLLGLESKTLEYRFVHNVLSADGDITTQGCKAFLRGIPTKIPGGAVEPGSSWSGDVEFSISRYQLFVNGEEKILIDKLKNICKINGVDYAKDLRSLL